MSFVSLGGEAGHLSRVFAAGHSLKAVVNFFPWQKETYCYSSHLASVTRWKGIWLCDTHTRVSLHLTTHFFSSKRANTNLWLECCFLVIALDALTCSPVRLDWGRSERAYFEAHKHFTSLE